ncbi:MAG TPA: undecaprenyl-diphosphate phosphatase [Candidatus Tyrphobacter sp.]
MTFTQAMMLALLQGVSELFPVSSLGHIILVPAVLQWHNIDRSDPTFLAFVVVLHLGTALALVTFYRREWWSIISALLRSIVRGRLSTDRDEAVGWRLVVGTIPVGIIGIVAQDPVRRLFGSASAAAAFLLINGFVMFVGEYLRRRQRGAVRTSRSIAQISYAQSVGVGVAQAFALLPGISRSGASIVGGLLCDLDHEEAAHYSFLLATPVILAAALLEIPRLSAPGAHLAALEAAAGAILAGIAAYLSVAFLTRYFKTNDLRPFGWYCVAFGAICLVLARLGVLA